MFHFVLIALLVLLSTNAFADNVPTDGQCQQVKSLFPDVFSNSESKIFHTDVVRHNTLGCYVSLTFFGNSEFLEFIKIRLDAGLTIDRQVVKNQGVADATVILRLSTPTMMLPPVLDENGKEIDPTQTLQECHNVKEKYLAQVDQAEVYLNSDKRCFVNLTVEDPQHLAKLMWDRSPLGETLIDKEQIERANTVVTFVPIWFSSKTLGLEKQ